MGLTRATSRGLERAGAGRPGRARVELAVASSPVEWEDVRATFSAATAFHSYDFLRAIAPVLNCEFIPLLVWSDGRRAGVAPLLVKRLGPFCTINWVPFPYLGPLVPGELLPATLAALRADARRRRAVNHQQSFSQVTPVTAADGFTSRTDRTFIIPLRGRSAEDLFASMHRKRRDEIRRAERAGFEITAAEPGDFALMDSWLRGLYASQGLPPLYPDGVNEAVFQALGGAPGLVSHAARRAGRTVGVGTALATSQRGYGWQVAVDPACRSDHPQALLTWHALLWARDAGAGEFDLVGAPSAGIAAYKTRWGAEERGYTVLRRQARAHRSAESALGLATRALTAGITPGNGGAYRGKVGDKPS